MKTEKGKLTPKQERFVQEYLIDLNATQAAVRAGYSEATAKQQGSRLLTNVDVAAALQKRQTRLADKYEVSAERVVRELALIGFSNMLDYLQSRDDGLVYLDMSAMTRDQAAAIQEVTVDQYQEPTGEGDAKRTVNKVKFKLSDKRAALVDLGKHLGLFREQVDITVTDGIATQIENARRRATEARRVN